MANTKEKKSTETKKVVKKVVKPVKKNTRRTGVPWWEKTMWKKWQSWNPKGRPRKGIAFVNLELEKKGYSPASKADIEANYMAMIQLTEKELKDFAFDMNQPMLIRVIAKSMLDKKGFEVIEKMLDRGIGKATMIVDNTHKGSMTLADGLIAISMGTAANLPK